MKPALLAPGFAVALASAAALADPLHAHYDAYAAGLNVLKLDADLDVSNASYRLDLDYRTAGTFGFFLPSHLDTKVEGVFQSGRAMPQRLFSAGTLRGEQRVTQVDYQDGQPVVRQLVPPAEAERDPVPAQLQRNTVDTLSAMAQLIRQVNTTGRCEGDVRTFDGRRLAELRAWTIGNEQLPPTRLSSYAGPALHCAFQGRQLAGFVRDESRERLERPQVGNAWFAQVSPGGPFIPVRISFHTRWFGDATMFLAPPG